MIFLLSKADLSVNMLYRTFTKREPTPSPVNIYSVPQLAQLAASSTANSKECE